MENHPEMENHLEIDNHLEIEKYLEIENHLEIEIKIQIQIQIQIHLKFQIHLMKMPILKKPKTNSSKIRCEDCNEELTQKNFGRHIQSLKQKKNERLNNRNKVIESANESGKKVTNEDIEQKIDKQSSELEGIKYCNSCDMYLDNNTAYNKHVETLKHKNNVELNNKETIKNGD